MATTNPNHTARSKRNERGITLLELMFIFCIVSVFVSLLIPYNTCRPSRGKVAQMQLKQISIGATLYAANHPDKPVDSALFQSSRQASEYLYETLCVAHSPKGPYLNIKGNTDSGQKPALISPLGGYYSFGFESENGRSILWVIVDPGKDKLLGGTMDAENGFVSDGSDANGDGKADSLDNIIEKVSLH